MPLYKMATFKCCQCVAFRLLALRSFQGGSVVFVAAALRLAFFSLQGCVVVFVAAAAVHASSRQFFMTAQLVSLGVTERCPSGDGVLRGVLYHVLVILTAFGCNLMGSAARYARHSQLAGLVLA